jgi:cysteinyl-tRNA synthetase
MLGAHYRSPLDYSEKNIKQAQRTLNRLIEFKRRLELIKKEGSNSEAVEKLAKAREDFYSNMADDFNTPKALAVLFDFIHETNPLIDKNEIGKENAEDILEFINNINSFFKVISKEDEIPEEIQEFAEEREQARKNRDFEKADELRKKMDEKGYVVKDTTIVPGYQILKK